MVRRSIAKILAGTTVEVFVRGIVVLSVAVGGLAWLQTRNLAQCVATYANVNNARSVALTEAADQERKAERAADDAQAALFLSPILTKPAAQQTELERAEVLRLFRAYQAALTAQTEERRQADDARREHPIPDPPREVCG